MMKKLSPYLKRTGTENLPGLYQEYIRTNPMTRKLASTVRVRQTLRYTGTNNQYVDILSTY